LREHRRGAVPDDGRAIGEAMASLNDKH
jgi:hypothetical protein